MTRLPGLLRSLALLSLLGAAACGGGQPKVGSAAAAPDSAATAQPPPPDGSAAPTADSAAHPGPYAVATYTTGIAAPHGAPYADPMIYFPADGKPPYPGIVFVPGHGDVYLEDPPLLTQWGTLLASRGFVMLFVNPSDLDTGPVGRTDALKAGLDALAAENTRDGSPLQGKLDTARMAVMGHSYGGSGALFATNASTDVRLQAALALCPVPGNNGPSYPSDSVPSLIIGGVGDIYADVNIKRQYRSIPDATPKYLALYAKTENVTLGSMHLIGHSPLGNHPQDASIARLGVAFFEVHLRGDQRYRQFLAMDPTYMTSFKP